MALFRANSKCVEPNVKARSRFGVPRFGVPVAGPEPLGKAGAVLNRWRTIADMSERNGARSRLGFAPVSLAYMGYVSDCKSN